MATFVQTLNLTEIGLPTLFKHCRFTVSSIEHKKWSGYETYLIKYKFSVDSAVLSKVSKQAAEILSEMSQNEIYFTVENNKSERYENKTPYIRCVFDKLLLEYIKRLFVSTLVYSQKKLPFPRGEDETIQFTFDTTAKTVTITDIHLYEPNDPYFEYARNAVATLSTESIGLKDYSLDTDKIKDFYSYDKISAWKKNSKLFERTSDGIKDTGGETTLEGQAGVYMLYDENSNELYIGKARNLRSRILQHAKNPDDSISNFTHYRYSVINLEYLEFLYLIENAAIHDCAMLLDMPKASKFRKPLAEVARKSGKSLGDCRIVNSVERQRKQEKK